MASTDPLAPDAARKAHTAGAAGSHGVRVPPPPRESAGEADALQGAGYGDEHSDSADTIAEAASADEKQRLRRGDVESAREQDEAKRDYRLGPRLDGERNLTVCRGWADRGKDLLLLKLGKGKKASS